MQRFLIERNIDGAGSMSRQALAEATRHSNEVLDELGPEINWEHSYVAGDRIYCVYSAPSEDLIREHASRAGFPADRITPVAAEIGPGFRA